LNVTLTQRNKEPFMVLTLNWEWSDLQPG